MELTSQIKPMAEEEVFDQWTVARGQTKSNC